MNTQAFFGQTNGKNQSSSWGLGSRFLVILLSLAVFNSCQWLDQNEETAAKKVSLPSVDGMTTTLEDEVRDLPNGQIAWSTYSKTCWNAYPDAEVYEIEVTTMEGTSPKLRRQKGSCHRLQIVAGRNAKSEGLLNRKTLIGLQTGQLAFRYRAVLDEGRFSEWSPVVMVREP